ncbi:hypothetical protein AVEN_91878-1 [Araneus ventricosus]|uniref:THAP-type domain-containing protein n=1 Tax=Araneus ventricosus TaxID=182803 RepID=A0A4Y2NSQ1_ARAVE|nr:hypothetical protein AVEN_91878-1 [Araneus ventricosus]
MKRDPKLNPELSASSIRHVCGDHFDGVKTGKDEELGPLLSRPFTSQINWIFWKARRKKPSKSMEIGQMACGGSNSVWTEIGTKNQRDPERG